MYEDLAALNYPWNEATAGRFGCNFGNFNGSLNTLCARGVQMHFTGLPKNTTGFQNARETGCSVCIREWKTEKKEN